MAPRLAPSLSISVGGIPRHLINLGGEGLVHPDPAGHFPKV